jgi:hypothetical protein
MQALRGIGNLALLILDLGTNGMCGQRHVPAALYAGERTPVTHWIRGWVGLRGDLGTEARGKTFASSGD